LDSAFAFTFAFASYEIFLFQLAPVDSPKHSYSRKQAPMIVRTSRLSQLRSQNVEYGRKN